MKSIVSILGITLILLLVSALTNPSESDFIDHVMEAKFAEIEENIGLSINPSQEITSNDVLRKLIQLSAKYQDYTFFSTYVIKGDNKETKYIGLFGFVFSTEEDSND